MVVDNRPYRSAPATKVHARGADGRLAKAWLTFGFSVVSNPEFSQEGAVDDFMPPDRIVVGAEDPQAIELMRQLYAPFQRNHDKLRSWT